jgi:DNA repair photolyase
VFYLSVMSRVEYLEVWSRSALNRVKGMPFQWSLNPYVGCVHACQYCYARAFYERAEHGNGRQDFETRILVKRNISELLRQELRRASWRGDLVALGTATDPYQPAEGRFRLTRRVLETFRDAVNPISIVTKSPLVYRDIDVLAQLARSASVRVFFTITTVDPGLWRRLEPGTANPLNRLRIMEKLVEAGVPAGVILAPIMPGITDSVESITAVVRAARDHGAEFFSYSALRLGATVRGHYLDFLTRMYPDLSARYVRAYSGAQAPQSYRESLDRRVQPIRETYGLVEESLRGRAGVSLPLNRLARPQLALPL